jgi:tetratricopeptide (TPR) repeat protein
MNPHFRQAAIFKPDYAEAHNNLGVALHDLGRLDEAAASYRRALALKPDHVHLHYNLGVIYREQGRLKEAVAPYRRALTLKPDYTEAHSNLLMCLSVNYLPGLSVTEYLDEARRFGRKAAKKVNRKFSEWTCAAGPDRLRIGMVSGDLRKHPVGYFLEKLLAELTGRTSPSHNLNTTTGMMSKGFLSTSCMSPRKAGLNKSGCRTYMR